MSLRRRLLAAFAYVIVLVLVALLVPLVLNLSRRVDAEVKAEAERPGAVDRSDGGRRAWATRASWRRLADRAAGEPRRTCTWW